MKKLCVVLLCLVVVLSLALPATAEECRHTRKHTVKVLDYDYPVYSLEDVDDPELFHWVIYEAWQYWECNACGENLSGKPLPKEDIAGTQLHEYVDGYCECGAEAPEGIEPDLGVYKASARSINDRLHTWEIRDIDGDALRGTSIGMHSYEGGVCKDCGHVNKCSHKPDTVIVTVTEGEDALWGEPAPDGGLDSGSAATITYCSLCGEILE